MTILALEFSSSHRSAALACDGCVLASAAETSERGTNAFGMIEQVLAAAKLERAQIGCLAVGLGPGSYTGIRVAISIAQGWQLARGVKLLGISSVECLAAQARAEQIFGRVHVTVDAQRGEFYLATYEVSTSMVKEVEALKIIPAAGVEARVEAGEIVVGPEITRKIPSGRDLFPSATMLATLAAGRTGFVAGEKLEPVYLRETSFVKSPRPRSVRS